MAKSVPVMAKSDGARLPGLLRPRTAERRRRMRYSGFRVIMEALSGHRGWQPVWRDPAPQAAYDYVIVGGGGHGLATAYYLAREFGQARIAVLEKSYLGSGNVGRNTTIIRSNYLLDGNEPFYEFSLRLWEGLEQDFNYNAMVSQRGIINLIHTDAQRDAFTRRGNAMLMNGADAELLDRDQVRRMYPFLNYDNARFPIKGALMQRRGGTVRHDAVAWGYARGADARGVDLIQNCEVTGMRIEGGRILGVETTRGFIGARKVGVAVAGSSSRVMACRSAPADRESRPAGIRVGGAEALYRRGDDLRRRALLCQPVRQGRAGLWR
jgi:sarcosine oxidase subunit beta